jgi:hypothetical protein
VTDMFGHVLPDTTVPVVFLLGDVNGDRAVNVSDTVQTRALSGAVVNGSTFRADVNINHAINAGDVLRVRAESATSVP